MQLDGEPMGVLPSTVCHRLRLCKGATNAALGRGVDWEKHARDRAGESQSWDSATEAPFSTGGHQPPMLASWQKLFGRPGGITGKNPPVSRHGCRTWPTQADLSPGSSGLMRSAPRSDQPHKLSAMGHHDLSPSPRLGYGVGRGGSFGYKQTSQNSPVVGMWLGPVSGQRSGKHTLSHAGR